MQMQIQKRNLRYLIITVLLVVLDQIVKYWVRETIPLFQTKPFLPNLVELTYVQNTGAAFSMLSSVTWLLALISLVASVFILFFLLRGLFPHVLWQIALALVLGGAIGNLIDRVYFGYVVDMFSLQFMDFAVFNVADIGVTVGGVLLCFYVLFLYNKGKENPKT
jgi:signal peptidase II